MLLSASDPVGVPGQLNSGETGAITSPQCSWGWGWTGCSRWPAQHQFISGHNPTALCCQKKRRTMELSPSIHLSVAHLTNAMMNATGPTHFKSSWLGFPGLQLCSVMVTCPPDPSEMSHMPTDRVPHIADALVQQPQGSFPPNPAYWDGFGPQMCKVTGRRPQMTSYFSFVCHLLST